MKTLLIMQLFQIIIKLAVNIVIRNGKSTMLLICGGYPNYNAQGAFVIIFFICSDLYNCLRSFCTVLVKLAALPKRNFLYETFSSNFLRSHSFKVL